jgi:hypothetical protein
VPRVWTYLQGAVKSAPWIHLAVLPPALAVTISWAVAATPAEQAAAWSIATVLGSVAAGLIKRPVHIAISSAAVTTIVGDLAVLGLHLPPSAAAAALAFASLVSPAASQIVPGQQAVPVAVMSKIAPPPPSEQVMPVSGTLPAVARQYTSAVPAAPGSGPLEPPPPRPPLVPGSGSVIPKTGGGW